MVSWEFGSSAELLLQIGVFRPAWIHVLISNLAIIWHMGRVPCFDTAHYLALITDCVLCDIVVSFTAYRQLLLPVGPVLPWAAP